MDLFDIGSSSHRLKNIIWGGYAIILMLIGIAYSPSLEHGPRGDQWFYLVDTMQDHTWRELVQNSYSYNRTRVICPGDNTLFRPGFFLLLATEKYWFGHQFFWWQFMGLLLHAVNVGLFYAIALNLLRSISFIKRLVYAWMGTAYFALNYSLQEMVISSHLHGYQVYLLLFLSIIFLLTSQETPFQPGARVRWFIWCLSLASVFFYELGLMVTGILGFFLAWNHWKESRVLASKIFLQFGAIIGIYFLCNVLDSSINRPTWPISDVRVAHSTPNIFITSIMDGFIFVVYTLIQPFFPWAVTGRIYDPGRLILPFMGKYLSWNAWNIASLLLVLSIVGWLLNVGRQWIKKVGFGNSTMWVLFFVITYGGYAGLIIVGRMLSHPLKEGILVISSYYTYWPQLLLLSLLMNSTFFLDFWVMIMPTPIL